MHAIGTIAQRADAVAMIRKVLLDQVIDPVRDLDAVTGIAEMMLRSSGLVSADTVR